MTPQTLMFIGRSGSGKGTQAKLLLNYLKEKGAERFYYLESGAKFREFIAGDGYTSKLSREINEHGGLQPEFLAIWVWSALLIQEFMDPSQHLVFDGTPRREVEARVFDSALAFYKRENPILFNLDVSREWSRARLKERRRLDDTVDEIERRLEWYDSEVAAVLTFFKSNPRYRVVDVNGEQSIEEVHKEIVKAVDAQLASGH